MEIKTIEEFEDYITLHNIKFTKSQQKVVDMWRRGYKLITVNQHRASGGEIYWTNDEGESLEYAGKVYRAVQFIFFACNRSSERISLTFAYSRNKNVTC